MNSVPADARRMLRRDGRPRRLAAMALIAPMLIFAIVNFVIPVALILYQSVDDREIGTVLVRTLPAVAVWDGAGVPDEATFAALRDDLREAQATRRTTIVATRLNAVRPGFQALVNATARRLATQPASSTISGPAKPGLIALDARWGETATWTSIAGLAGAPFTAMHVLRSLDLTIEDGHLVQVPEPQRIFVALWLRSFWIALGVAGLCVLLGYPLAYVMAHARPGTAQVMLILTLLPFWTSLLVRSMAWVALLQTQGPVNEVLMALHLTSEPLPLIRNRLGVMIAMIHVLLPYMVIPLYGVMRRVPPSTVRAALSLGATPFTAFWRVYLPQTLHGVGAGIILVFVLAVGFYVTPALVGGRGDQMISWFIAYFMNESSNWNQSAALSLLLLLFTVVVYVVLSRVFRTGRMAIR